eukprot:m.86049 g.86049  ORF g.86049 m.86049 type:complete len:1013 (-) comp13042_c0_seq1:1204-4242(-)
MYFMMGRKKNKGKHKTSTEKPKTSTSRDIHYDFELLAYLISRGDLHAFQRHMKPFIPDGPLPVSRDGKSILHVAAMVGALNIIDWIMEVLSAEVRKDELSRRDRENSWTPLHRSVYFGQLGACARMVAARAPIELSDNDGYSVLDLYRGRVTSMEQISSNPRPNRNRVQSSQVFSWGSGRNFNLGHSDGNSKSKPTLLPKLERENVISVATSLYHSLFLTESGKVFVCGYGRGFRLGTGSEETVIMRRPITWNEDSPGRMIAAARDHSALVTEDGHLFLWGSNEFGQLGCSSSVAKTPTLVRSLSSIFVRGVSLGDKHTIVWGDDVKTGEQLMYAFGLNNGQLGLQKGVGTTGQADPGLDICSIPKLVNLGPSSIAMVSTGTHLTAVIAVDNSPRLYILSDYQCHKMKRSPADGLLLETPSKVRCCETSDGNMVLATLWSTGKMSLFVKPVEEKGDWHDITWKCSRRGFKVLDMEIGINSAGMHAVVIRDDGCVYTSLIRLDEPKKTISPVRIPGIHQAFSLFCGPSFEHFFCFRTDRSFPDDPDWNSEREQKQAGNEAKAAKNIEDVVLCINKVSTIISSRYLSQSPFMEACLSGRWELDYDRAGNIIIEFDVPVDVSFDSVVPNLASFLKEGKIQQLDTLSAMGLLAVSDVMLLPSLCHLCEVRLAEQLNITNIRSIFNVAIRFNAEYLIESCALCFIRSFELFLEAGLTETLSSEQLKAIDNAYKKIDSKPPISGWVQFLEPIRFSEDRGISKSRKKSSNSCSSVDFSQPAEKNVRRAESKMIESNNQQNETGSTLQPENDKHAQASSTNNNAAMHSPVSHLEEPSPRVVNTLLTPKSIWGSPRSPQHSPGTLMDIMAAEKKITHDFKSSPVQVGQKSRRMSQKERKKIATLESTPSPKSDKSDPWGKRELKPVSFLDVLRDDENVTNHSPANEASPSQGTWSQLRPTPNKLANIMLDEEKRKVAQFRKFHKTLQMIQLEEKALSEVWSLYDCSDEQILSVDLVCKNDT